jgi:PKD repeat protein
MEKKLEMKKCIRNRIKSLILSLSILWLLSAPPAEGGAAEGAADIKPILLKILSSVADPNIGNFPRDDLETTSLPGRDAKSMSAPLSVSPVQLYFPLNNSDVKNYEGSIYGNTYYATYNYSQVFYNGRTCYLETDSADGSKTYYGYSGSELQMFGGSDGIDNFQFDSPLKILDDSILNNGGSLQSSTTFTLEGITVNLNVTVNSNLAGSVTIPLGRADNCRAVDMNFSYSIPGESETLDVKDVWILAPNIGKLKIAVMDDFMIQRGWMAITGGTVAGKKVAEILNPTAADFAATPLYGLAPLAVSFTDRSTGSLTNWSWDFGDGTTSFSRNPSHVYSKPGTYSVSLTVSATGVSDTEVKTAYIRADHAGADLNNDNKVDLSDAILALQFLSNGTEASGIPQDKDVNGDDRFGLEEAIHILQNISRLR